VTCNAYRIKYNYKATGVTFRLLLNGGELLLQARLLLVTNRDSAQSRSLHICSVGIVTKATDFMTEDSEFDSRHE
jgi:hypothetical protein